MLEKQVPLRATIAADTRRFFWETQVVDDLNKEFGVDRAIGTSADLSETEGREALVRCASRIPRHIGRGRTQQSRQEKSVPGCSTAAADSTYLLAGRWNEFGEDR